MHYVHIPATFSVCSNVPGHIEPVHMVSDGNPQNLVDEMVKLQLQHQAVASKSMRAKFQWVFDTLTKGKEFYRELVKSKNQKNVKCDEDMRKYNQYSALLCDFQQYCDRLPVIGFNSQRYDIPLIRRYLPSSLERLDSLPGLVIRKESSYMALGTKRLKYLDLTNYLAAGTSLDAFYKAYNVTNPKGFFCYEWFDSLDKLNNTELPPREAFYSTLKNDTISQDDYEAWQQVWNTNNMQRFGDYVK